MSCGGAVAAIGAVDAAVAAAVVFAFTDGAIPGAGAASAAVSYCCCCRCCCGGCLCCCCCCSPVVLPG